MTSSSTALPPAPLPRKAGGVVEKRGAIGHRRSISRIIDGFTGPTLTGTSGSRSGESTAQSAGPVGGSTSFVPGGFPCGGGARIPRLWSWLLVARGQVPPLPPELPGHPVAHGGLGG